jgi:hypothetical protein
MDTLTIVIQVLSVAALVAVIIFFCIGIYILGSLVGYVKDVKQLLEAVRFANQKAQDFKENIYPQIQNSIQRFIQDGPGAIFRLLTRRGKRR